VNPARIDLAPTYLKSEWRIRDHVVLSEKEKKKNDFEKILIFFKVNPTKTWPCSYVFHSEWKIRDHV